MSQNQFKSSTEHHRVEAIPINLLSAAFHIKCAHAAALQQECTSVPPIACSVCQYEPFRLNDSHVAPKLAVLEYWAH